MVQEPSNMTIRYMCDEGCERVHIGHIQATWDEMAQIMTNMSLTGIPAATVEVDTKDGTGIVGGIMTNRDIPGFSGIAWAINPN